VQHSEELDVVPLGLIGQRWPASMFISAQQKRFCRTVGTGSLGRTGVKEATLIARRANSIRADVVIGMNGITNEAFSKPAQSTPSSNRAIEIVDAKPGRNFIGNCYRANSGADSRFDANLHRYRRAGAKSM
jgi:hypothetical protein